MRYQTSSISKNAKPDRRRRHQREPHRVQPGASGPAVDGGWSVGSRSAHLRATRRAHSATSAFSAQAVHSMRRVPRISSSANVDSSVPGTAPSVLAP